MPKKQRLEFELLPRKHGDQIRVSSDQIVLVPSRPPDRLGRPLPTESEDHRVLYRYDGSPYIIAADRAQSCQEIAFAELEGGALVDLIRDSSNPRQNLFVVWNNNYVKLADHLPSAGKILVPLRNHEHVLAKLVLPTDVAPYESVRDLAHKIRRAIRSCVRLPNPYPSLLAAWVIHTWLADRMPIAIHLCICGLTESGKTTLLELLRLFCRRSLLTADISTAGFYEASSLFSPTLMIDEAELDQRSSSQDLRRLLRAATNRNHSIMRKGFSGDVFGPKIICGEDPPADAALLSRCLVVRMVEQDTAGLNKPSDPEIVMLSQELQKQLLYFRLKNYHTIHAAQVAGAERLHPRQRDLLTYIAAAFADDSEWPALLLQCFEVTSQASPPSLAPPEAAVLDGLWTVFHRRAGWQFVFNTELVKLTLELYKAAGQGIRLEPVSVGRILKRFGIDSGMHRNSGNGFWMTHKASLRIHELVKKYGLTLPSGLLVSSAPVRCGICESAEADSAMRLDEEDLPRPSVISNAPGNRDVQRSPKTSGSLSQVKEVKDVKVGLPCGNRTKKNKAEVGKSEQVQP